MFLEHNRKKIRNQLHKELSQISKYWETKK